MCSITNSMGPDWTAPRYSLIRVHTVHFRAYGLKYFRMYAIVIHVIAEHFSGNK